MVGEGVFFLNCNKQEVLINVGSEKSFKGSKSAKLITIGFNKLRVSRDFLKKKKMSPPYLLGTEE